MSGAAAVIRWHANPRRVVDRLRLALARVLHAAAETMADAACRVAPPWEGER